MTPLQPTTNREQTAAAVALRGKQILLTRAAELARVLPETVADTQVFEVLEFGLGKERYAVQTEFVREVCLVQELTPLPCTPAFVAGIVNVRGQILPVLDLRRLLGLVAGPVAVGPRVAILVRGAGLELGMLADQITGVRKVRRAEVQPVPLTLTRPRDRYLLGVTNGCLVVLDLARMLADKALIVDEVVSA